MKWNFLILLTGFSLLVAYGIVEAEPVTLGISGGSLTWNPTQVVDVVGYTEVRVWTAVVDVDKSMTVSFTRTNEFAIQFGGNVLVFRNSGGVGASSQTNVASGAPTLNITTTKDNSAIVVVNGDWNAVDGATRTWRTNAGALTETTYVYSSGKYTAYGGYHANAGAIGTYAVGLSSPTQKYAIVAVEIKGP